MTTVSSLSTSSLLQALSANGNSSGDSSLASAIGQAQTADGTGTSTATPSDQLLQTLVTLTSGSPADPSSQTYNAQGLLNSIQAAMPQDPLFASDNGSGSDSSASNSLLGGILDPSQNSGNAATPASASSTAANLLQLFQQSPTLASTYVNGQLTQSLFSDMA